MFDIIIPVYNNRKLLQKALSSLFVQTLSYTLDIYIIDDGSQESYEDIVSYYADSEKFHNIFLLTNPKNMGVGYCRQKAIEISKEMTNNPWIFFLDSDDYLYSPYAFNRLIIASEQYPNAACIAGSAFEEIKPLNEKVLPSYENSFIALTGCIVYFHGKLYSRKAIKQSGLRIPSTRSNEDGVFNIAFKTIYNKPEDFVFLDNTTLCFVTYNPKSITRSENSSRRCWGVINCNEYMDNYIALKEIFKTLEKNVLKKQENYPL